MSDELPDNAVVYVVDDDPSVRKALTRMFKTRGWPVYAFASAKEFIAAGRTDVSACLLLDVQMPGLSGLELQELLSSHRIDLPIIFMTAHGDIPMSVKAMKAGAIDFLPKPLEPELLLQTVRKAIEQHAGEREANAGHRKFRQRVESLTPREREVMSLVVQGFLNKQIADRLDIAEITVKVHRGRVMRKTGVDSVAELVKLCERAGVPIPED